MGTKDQMECGKDLWSPSINSASKFFSSSSSTNIFYIRERTPAAAESKHLFRAPDRPHAIHMISMHLYDIDYGIMLCTYVYVCHMCMCNVAMHMYAILCISYIPYVRNLIFNLSSSQVLLQLD